jgi:multisubunit Na+/H+ antiporter MnhG subunit
MNLTTILNIIGLIFDIVGSIFIFKFIPTFWSLDKKDILRLTPDSDFDKNKKFSKIGIGLIIIGFSIQFLSNLLILFII